VWPRVLRFATTFRPSTRMNNPHKDARTPPLGRAEMIRRIVEDGRPVADVAAGFGISERRARTWLARWRAEGANSGRGPPVVGRTFAARPPQSGRRGKTSAVVNSRRKNGQPFSGFWKCR